MDFITLTKDNIESEHICCAFSDKKCTASYEAKKQWLKQEFDNDYVFYRLNERAKVFIEYGPAEKAWVPITANNSININCFWVSGKYKKSGLGKRLLEHAVSEAKAQGKNGLVTVVGKKKCHFMSDGKWLLRQGFEEVDETNTGFVLLRKNLKKNPEDPQFNPEAKKGNCPHKEGLAVYYSNRCPFAEYHVLHSLKETAQNKHIPLQINKITTAKQAQKCPSPATIFSLFYEGKFLTTDLSVCQEDRFDKFWKKHQIA